MSPTNTKKPIKLKVLRRACSILLLIILAFVSVVFFVVTSLRMNILTPRFLKHELASRGVYALALRQADLQIEKITLDPQYPVTHAEIASLAHDLVTEQWLQQNMESVIDGFAAWLGTPPGTVLTLPIEVGQVRDRVASTVDAFLSKKLPELKPCPKTRQAKEEQGICQFAGLTVAQVKEQFAHMGIDISGIQKLVPDRLDLIRPDLSAITGPADPDNPDGVIQKGAKIQAQLEEVKRVYSQAMQYFRYAWGGYALVVAAYFVLNGTRGWRRFIRWAGILLLTVSLLPIAISIASTPVVHQVVLPKITFSEGFPAAIQSEALAAIEDVRRATFLPLLILMAFLATFGLAGIIGAHWIPKPVSR